MTSLADRYPHERDQHVTFDEESHTYCIDGSSAGVISVTTLIHHHFPQFNANDIIAKMKKGNQPHPKYGTMTADEIKKSWDDSGKIASGLGTKLHKKIESYYNGEEVENDSIEFGYFLAFDETVMKRLTPYRTEWSIFHKDIKLAGQLDMLYSIDDQPGKYALYDWKRSKEIKLSNKFEKGLGQLSDMDNCNFSHYSLQLNIYKYILEMFYGLTIVEMVLVILHPDNKTFLLFPVKKMTERVEYLFEHRRHEVEEAIRRHEVEEAIRRQKVDEASK